MSTELAVTEGWTPEKIDLIKRTICVGATDDELQLFLYVCKKTGLDPLTRQIYALKRYRKDMNREVMTVQTGIDGYRVIADRTGKLAGISDPVFDTEENKFPGRATVTVKKVVDGAIAEFTATARWSEYVQTGKDGGPMGMWQKMPFLMLGKCSEALALRKAFPADLSGVYTAEEMAQADSEPQRQAVEAEVQRQKASHAALASQHHLDGKGDAGIEPLEPHEQVGYVPPELDWMYQKSSGVLICRLVDVQKKNKKAPAKGEFIAVKLNQNIDGKNLAFYFHDSHRDELLAARGKVCKFMVSTSADGKFLNIDEVLEIDGQPAAKEEGDPEVKARLLASTLDMGEGDLKVMLVQCFGEWAEVLSRLEQYAAEKEAVTT